MNLPNKLTVLRLFLTVFFVASLAIPYPFHQTVALGIFVLASLTDYLDGVIARRYNLITDFGKLMDPLADKILTASAFICLIPLGAIQVWAVILIISREFLITGLRLLAGTKNQILPAEKLGKHKTAWQMITIVFFLLLFASREWATEQSDQFLQTGRIIGNLLVSITVILTAYSGLAYFWKNRRLLESL